METDGHRLRRFHADFAKLRHNRDRVPPLLLRTRYARSYNTLAAEVVDGADWFFRKFMEKLAFPTHPGDTAGNEWLAQRLAILEEDEKRPSGLVEQYRAALLERLDMAEYQNLVCQAYERRVQMAYAPYWARHCRRLDSGWIYNDILQKFWLPSESGRSGGWINSDYSGWDAKFPPHLKEELP